MALNKPAFARVNNGDLTAAACMQRDDTCYICGKSVSDNDLKCTYTHKPFTCSRIAHASCVEASDACAPATQSSLLQSATPACSLW